MTGIKSQQAIYAHTTGAILFMWHYFFNCSCMRAHRKRREREREREGDVKQAKKKFTRPFVVVVACLLKIGMCMIDRRIFTFVLVRFDSSN
jgi:hypothetical protein